MWQILKREKGSGDAARFADRISDYAFFDGDVAPLDAGLLESRLPSGHPHLPDVFQDWGAESGFGGDLGLQ